MIYKHSDCDRDHPDPTKSASHLLFVTPICSSIDARTARYTTEVLHTNLQPRAVLLWRDRHGFASPLVTHMHAQGKTLVLSRTRCSTSCLAPSVTYSRTTLIVRGLLDFVIAIAACAIRPSRRPPPLLARPRHEHSPFLCVAWQPLQQGLMMVAK
jgi:hypothetical protein